jgi:superfamily II DNA or RNA helicase/very-short-patch-repair endonuclease
LPRFGLRMETEASSHVSLRSESFLEYAFLRWVLAPATLDGIVERVRPQREVEVGGRRYRLDYEIEGLERLIAVELDGFEFHSSRPAFSYDRLRQNDIHATGRVIVRFSYDSIRRETRRCVEQLQAVLRMDPLLASLLVEAPVIERPEMDPDPLYALQRTRPGIAPMTGSYFDGVRDKLNQKTLRDCQTQAFAALANYYGSGGTQAACVMSVGAGKTALGVAASLAFTGRRAMVITPGSVIRGTFDRAYDHQAVNNVLYGLPAGPLIPGCRPPNVLTLDRDDGAIRDITRDDLLASDILVTNFHSLGTGEDEDDLLRKLQPSDIDFIVIDEAHIAAAESYQRAFAYFTDAKKLLMSACFQRLDGRPIDADVVYRYRLIDSIVDGNAKNLRVQRFAPEVSQTTYEMVWPDGAREEIVGRDALMELIADPRKLARITAKSNEPIRQVMRTVKTALDRQAELLYPVKPRVLFAALGERHAEQIARIACEHGIPSAHVHHSMTERHIKDTRERYEKDSGDLQGLVQLKMLGQGYDFPPICVVVPMRPYGGFSEFYQFVGRGIRVLTHPALTGRVAPGEQWLDVIYHAELGLDEHIETIYAENDMDPLTEHVIPEGWGQPDSGPERAGSTGVETAGRPDTFVMFERGTIEQRVVHDDARVEQRRAEREREALAQRYATYAQANENPVSFEQFADVIRQFSE